LNTKAERSLIAAHGAAQRRHRALISANPDRSHSEQLEAADRADTGAQLPRDIAHV